MHFYIVEFPFSLNLASKAFKFMEQNCHQYRKALQDTIDPNIEDETGLPIEKDYRLAKKLLGPIMNIYGQAGALTATMILIGSRIGSIFGVIHLVGTLLINFGTIKGHVAGMCSNSLSDGSKDPLVDFMTTEE